MNISGKGDDTIDVINHYNALIEENNDPVYDPAPILWIMTSLMYPSAKNLIWFTPH